MSLPVISGLKRFDAKVSKKGLRLCFFSANNFQLAQKFSACSQLQALHAQQTMRITLKKYSPL